MQILVAHNFYQQAGGEDQVFAAETAMLRAQGNDVREFTLRNDDAGAMGRLSLAAATIWNGKVARRLYDAAAAHRAQIVHFHNTFPLMSPASYYASRRAGAAVVQTLHNYRMLCPAATCYRNGKACDKCVGRSPLPAIAHKCYRDSRSVSAVAALSLMIHRGMQTYDRAVDRYIALTHFARDKFISAGFAEDKLDVKPNFVDPDPGLGAGAGNFALFVGRLTEEKGIRPMLAAWKTLGARLPLTICGDGPLADEVRAAAATNPAICFLGRQPLAEVMRRMGEAALLVFPSLWYEGLPRTIVEAYAKGTPVAASDLGSMTELVHPGRTGVRFAPGNVESMVREIGGLFNNRGNLLDMRGHSRAEYEARYTAGANYQQIMRIYQRALKGVDSHPRTPLPVIQPSWKPAA